MTFVAIGASRVSCHYSSRVCNSLNPDQDRYSVGPDLGPNCLHRQQNTHVAACKERVKGPRTVLMKDCP